MAFEGLEQLDDALESIERCLTLLDLMGIVFGRGDELLARFHVLAAGGSRMEAQQAATELYNYRVLIYGVASGEVMDAVRWIEEPEACELWNICVSSVSGIKSENQESSNLTYSVSDKQNSLPRFPGFRFRAVGSR